MIGEGVELQQKSSYCQSRLFTALVPYFNNIGITSDSNPAIGNFNTYGNTYSAEKLATQNITPGAIISLDGIYFMWPNISSGENENIATNGEIINLTDAFGSKLGVFGAGTLADQNGYAIITYTDNTTQRSLLSLYHWIDQKPVQSTFITWITAALTSRTSTELSSLQTTAEEAISNSHSSRNT
ncbi:unnamed protein product [Didymodactylos carnosus]|uniref:Uncharacterized protein n=1 Tax=Didymodactylos carnosus TaxID=1234261 RepID=A0A814HG27_9BILA|nr:unnamed protein product [Didymodactylos carnosus]CAF3780058.1 unnamed protein product [Didymodactylos carnosus]